MTEPSRALVEAACTCADRGVDRECHCALLRDFPGGFYDDMTNAEYMGDDSLWCDCDCHAPGPDYDDDAELAAESAQKGDEQP